MAKATMETSPPVTIPGVTMVTLTLDEQEAGYLLELLHAHVAGSLASTGRPLDRIRVALKAVNVTRLIAYNSNRYRTSPHPHSCLYRTIAEAKGEPAEVSNYNDGKN